MDATDGNLPDNLEQLKAAIQLAADDEVFFIHRDKDGTIVPCLLLNDTFFYACADAEDVPWGNIIQLRDRIREGGWAEGIRWAQEEGSNHKGLLPIPPTQHSMNEWDRMKARITLLEKHLQDILYYERFPNPNNNREKLIDRIRGDV